MATAPAPIQLPSIYQNIKAPAGTNPADAQAAQDQMAVTYAPQESGINTVISQLQQHLANDTNAQQQYGTIADQKISDIGNQVQQQLQGNVGNIQGIYQQGQGNIQSAYDEEQQTLGDVGASIANPIKQGMANMGIKADAYGTDPLSRLQANLATMQGRAATGKASAVSNMATLGTQLSAIAQKAVGDSVANYGQKRADVATQVLKTIGQLQTTTNDNIMTQLQKFSDLATTEGPAFRQLLTAATTARNAATRQNALDQIDMALKSSQIDKNEAAADPNSLDNQVKALDIQTKTAALNKQQYSDSGQGNAAMMDWLNDLRVNKGLLTGYQYAGIQNFVNQNANKALALNEDPYTYLTTLAQSGAGKDSNVPVVSDSGKKVTVPLDVILGALSKRYTGVASSGAKIGTTIK